MEPVIEDEKVEKIPTPNRERIFKTFGRLLLREARIITKGLKVGLQESIMLLGRIFVPQSVDRSVQPEAGWFEVHPKEPNGEALLLCHGFAATPQIFREIAPKLAEQGYYVRSIRLSGHGTSLGHLAQTTSVDWFASVVWHYQQIADKFEEITYIGHSLGGTLGMILATIYEFKSFIAMCSPIELDIKSAKFVREASVLVKYWPRSPSKLRKIKEEGLASYPASPLYAIGGIFDATRMVRERAELLTLPMLYIKAALDHKTLVVQPKKIEKYLKWTPVTLKIAENSPHSLLQGPERDLVAEWIIDWLEEH